MSDEIEMFQDGDGIALIGDPKALDVFLSSAGIPSKDLGLPRLSRATAMGSGAAQSGAAIAENAGRWVKLTEDSARAFHTGQLMTGSSPGLGRAIIVNKGKTSKILEIVQTPGTMLTNPAILSGTAGIMAQLAIQQAMEEIADYLVAIDAKVDEVLRNQKDSAFADMIGVELVIHEAMSLRESVMRVSEITWSKVQATTFTIARTQAYALRQIDGLAEKIERAAKVGDAARVAKESEAPLAEWLSVLARCFQLQNAITVLELDRVLDAEPEELDAHREGLIAARKNRLDLFAESTERLLERMNKAIDSANAQVLLHPATAGTVVSSGSRIVDDVISFQDALDIEDGHDYRSRKKWKQAAAETKDRAVDAGAAGIVAVGRAGEAAADLAKGLTGRFSTGLAERAARHRRSQEKSSEVDES
ncbi:hypothetical protein [Brachybacterium huguangmaarense]